METEDIKLNGATCGTEMKSVSHQATKMSGGTRKQIALTVKRVYIKERSGHSVLVNCLEDPGSQVTLTTEKIAGGLDLKKINTSLSLSGIGENSLCLHEEVELQVEDEQGDSEMLSVKCVCM